MPAYPSTLPQFALVAGYQESEIDTTIETRVDAGRPKARRRFTATVDRVTLTIRCTDAQVATFETFYRETVRAVEPFTWLHPRTRAAGTFAFRGGPPRRSVPFPGAVDITFTLEEV